MFFRMLHSIKIISYLIFLHFKITIKLILIKLKIKLLSFLKQLLKFQATIINILNNLVIKFILNVNFFHYLHVLSVNCF